MRTAIFVAARHPTSPVPSLIIFFSFSHPLTQLFPCLYLNRSNARTIIDHTPYLLSSLNAPIFKLDTSNLEFASAPAKVQHRIYVGGLPAETTSRPPIFEQFGALQKFDLVPNLQNPLLCRGYCFVDYRNPADAKAIEAAWQAIWQLAVVCLKVQFAKCGLSKAKPADSHRKHPATSNASHTRPSIQC